MGRKSKAQLAKEKEEYDKGLAFLLKEPTADDHILMSPLLKEQIDREIRNYALELKRKEDYDNLIKYGTIDDLTTYDGI